MTAFAAIALSVCAVADAPLAATVALEPAVIPFHRQAVLTVTIDAPAGTDAELVDIAGRVGGLSIHGTPERSVTARRDGRQRIVERYALDPIFAGEYGLGPIEVAWAEDGERHSTTVPAPGLRVRELTPEEVEAAMHFEPIAGPHVLPAPLWADWRLWLAASLLAAAACGGGIWCWRRRHAGARLEPVREAPWEVAYRRLQELDQRQLPKAGKYEPYYVDLSAILRYYIEDRFKLHAPERTTPEFLNEASGSGLLSDVHQRILANLLRHCDRVKFAQHQPTIDEMDRSLAAVLKFVDETVPAPADEAPEEDAA